MTARAEALALLAACRGRAEKAAAATSDETKTHFILRDRVLNETDMAAALVLAVLDVADAIREATTHHPTEGTDHE